MKSAAARPSTLLPDTQLAMPADSNAQAASSSSGTSPSLAASKAASSLDQVPVMFLTPAQRAAKAQAELDARKAADREARKRNSQLVSKPGKLNPFFTRVASSASDATGGRVVEGAQQAAWRADPDRLTAEVTRWNLATFPGALGTPRVPLEFCAPPRPAEAVVAAPSLPASARYHSGSTASAATAAAAGNTPRSTAPTEVAQSCISTFTMGPLQGMPQHLLLPVVGREPTPQCIEAAAACIAAEYAQVVAQECGVANASPEPSGVPLLVSARAVHTSQRAPPLPVAARMSAKHIAGLVHALLQHVVTAAQATVPCGVHEVAQWWWRQWYQAAAPMDPGSVITCRSTAMYMAEWLGVWQPSGLPLDQGEASNESWCSAVDPTFARAMLLLGQPGSGRSAAVSAAAAAAGYSVLRIGPDWYPNRSKRAVLQAVGEAASSARLHTGPASSPEQPSSARTVLLLDDVDVLYAQDRGFCDAVLSLATQGLCPIIATAAQCPEWLMGTPLWVRLPLLPPALCDVWVVARAIAWAARCAMSAQEIASVVAARNGQLAAAVQDIQAANSLSVLCGVAGVPSENGAIAQALAAQLVEASSVSDPGMDCVSEPENLVSSSSSSDSDIEWMPGFSPGEKRPRGATRATVPARRSTPPAPTQQAVALAALVDSAVVRHIPALLGMSQPGSALQAAAQRSILPATTAAQLCGTTLETSMPERHGPTVQLVHPAECPRPARPMSEQDVWTVVVEGHGFTAPGQPMIWLKLVCLADDSQHIACPAVVRSDTQAVARIPTAAFPADATLPAFWSLLHADQLAAQAAGIASQARAPGCIVHVVAVRHSAVPASDVSDDGDMFEDEVVRGELQAPSAATGPTTPVQHWGCAVSAEELAALQHPTECGAPACLTATPLQTLSRCSTPMDAVCAAADARAFSDCLGTVRAHDACWIRGLWRGPAPCVQPVPRTADVYDNLLSDWSAASTVIEHVVDQSQGTLPSGPAAVERAVSQALSACSNRARVAHAALAPETSAPALFADEGSDNDSDVVAPGGSAGQAEDEDECALLHMVQRTGSGPCGPALLLLHAHLATLLGMTWLASAAVPGARSCLERAYAARAGGWYESMKAPVPPVGSAKTPQLGRDRSSASGEPESGSAVPTLDGSSAGRLSMSMAAGETQVCEQVRAQLDGQYQGALRQAYECDAVPFELPDGESAWTRNCEAMACVHALVAGSWASNGRGLPGLAHATLAPGTGTGAARGSSAAREALFGTSIVGQMAYFGAVRSMTSHRRSKRWQHPLLTSVPGLSNVSIALMAILGAPSLASADPDVFGLT